MGDGRRILHVDMDAFFASVEQRDDPALRGKPVLVGGTGKRGVVAAASYEAREFGCRSAMPTAVARRLCPQAVIVRGRFEAYRDASRAVFEILESFTPLVQPVSIDEAFLDVTGSVKLLGEPESIATDIRARIRQELNLPASVGVAPNKFLAKLASQLAKPDGIRVIDPDKVQETLDPLPVSLVWGVGPSAEERLKRMGVRTIAELRAVGEETLAARFGEFGDHLWRLARGLDDRPVHSDREAKTISHEQTFGENLADPAEVRAVLLSQGEAVARRLRRHGRFAASVVVKIRFGDFETVTRSRTLDEATDRTDVICATARALFDDWARSFRSVRLIGVGVGGLTDAGSAGGLFDHERGERQRAVDRATDRIAAKFGTDAIRRAGSMNAPGRHGAHGPGSQTPRDAGDDPPPA
ncbi:MAG: DNA polymerase IV [Phycisphaerales bacterium]